MESDKTIVVFRKWRDTGSVLALFPFELHNGRLCMSYEHIGQHGAADYGHCIDATVSAMPKEYAALKRELEGLGYKLSVRKKAVRSKN